jgi:iron complex outermembrane recepter protein
MIKSTKRGAIGRDVSLSALIIGLSFAATSVPIVVFAQAAPEAPTSGEEVVVVTATRREQALQNTPIAITAVGGAALERQSVTSTQDLQRVAPTLAIQSAGSESGTTSIRIRGVGTTGNNPGLEGAVGVFIDGVYRQRSGLAMNNLFDIARIEVLRGPQGTLFGKNTSAGAISVVPKTPKLGEFEGQLRLNAGNFSNLEADGAINLPASGNFAVRLSGAVQQRDGYIKDALTGRDFFDRDRKLFRVQALWAPSDAITIRLTADTARKNEACCVATFKSVGPPANAPTQASNLWASNVMAALVPGATIPLNASDRLAAISSNRNPIEATEETGFAGHLTWELGGGTTLKAILASREFESRSELDIDYNPADIAYQRIISDQTLQSAEVTLNGNFGIVNWLVGGFYANEDTTVDNSIRYGTQLKNFVTLSTGGAINAATAAVLYPTDGGATSSAFSQEGTSWSVFTHNQIQFTEKFGAVFGLRWNNEEKSGGATSILTNSPSCGGGPFFGQGAAAPAGIPAALRLLCPRPTYQSSIDDGEATGTLGINWRPNRDSFFYASLSRGYKAGGINLDRDAPAATGLNAASGLVTGTQAAVNAAAAFAPEFSNSLEAGFKGRFLERRLNLSQTFFFTDYEDFQLNTFNGVGFAITNAGGVESVGFETEANFKIIPSLDLNVSIAHVQAKYGFDPLLLIDPADQLPPPNGDPPLAGKQLTNAPKWTATGGFRWEHALGNVGRLYVDGSAAYRGETNTGSDLSNAKIQKPYTLVSARVGIYNDDKGWEATLWGTNLTDETYQTISFDSVFQTGSIHQYVGAPRMWGVSLKKSF